MEKINIILDVLTEPKTFADVSPVFLTDETIEMRKKRMIQRMREEAIDTLIIYADR